MNNRMHIFNFHNERWYDEEFNGPLEATTYLDPETGNLYLEVREGDFSIQDADETWIVHIDPVVCKLKEIINDDIPGPPTWVAYESKLPKSVLPLKTRATKPTKHNSIDTCWQAAW